MKKTLFILSFAFTFRFASAQVPHYSIIDTSLEWHYTHDVGHGGQICDYFFIRPGDTVIGSNIYHLAVDFSQFWIRQDSSQRCYIYQPTGDRLIYDFGAQVGDTIYYTPGGTQYYLIDSVYTTMINGNPRRTLNYFAHDSVANYSGIIGTWIEGIGDVTYGLIPPALIWYGPYLGVTQSGQVLYLADTMYTYCPLAINEQKANNIQISPLPASDYLNVVIDGGNAPYHYSLFDMRGALLTSAPLTTGHLSLRNFNAGVYLLYISDADGYTYSQKILKE